MNRKYTWKKQKEDVRDLDINRLRSVRMLPTTPPPVANNRYWCSEVEDQGNLGSCTANAWAGLMEYSECKNGRGGKLFHDFSRLFIYYNERAIENTIDEDSGAYLRDGAKAIASKGACFEKDWPYIIDKFTARPNESCYKNALDNKIGGYYSLDGRTPQETLLNLKTCIAAGRCFVFGFMVYDGFESKEVLNTGILQLPKSDESILGGHAVMAVGYNDEQQRFLIKNSWGRKWGLKNPKYRGYFTMPYEYISDRNLASDFWTITRVL